MVYRVKLLWISFIALYFYQFLIIQENSIDIPFQDEWKYFEPGHPMCFPDKFSLNWLLTRSNEHFIVLTQLMAWANLKLFGMNFHLQKLVNFVIYGLLLYKIIQLKNKLVTSDNFPMFPAFLIFTLSPIAAENHIWAFQSQFHFVLIFFVMLVMQMANKETTTLSTLFVVLITNLAMYSLSAGVIFVIVCIVFRGYKLLVDCFSNQMPQLKLFSPDSIILIVTVLSIILWFTGYHKPDAALNRTWPNEFVFWDYFFNLLSFGFGFSTLNILPGFVLFLFTILPVLILLTDKKSRARPEILSICAAIAGLIAVLMAISLGRASIGEPKTSRYAEFALLLIPFVAIAWWLLLEKLRQRTAVLALFWTICFCSFFSSWNEWSFDKYRYVRQFDASTLDCVRQYYNGSGDGNCQGFWMAPEDLDYAQKLNLNFTKP